MRLDEEKKKHAENIVLVIDDDAASRQKIQKTFAREARLIEADNADMLATTYLQYLPNLVLIDAAVSMRNGDAVSEILSHDKEAFIVILSNDCTQAMIVSSKNRGAKGFICKPLKHDILMKYLALAGAKTRAKIGA